MLAKFIYKKIKKVNKDKKVMVKVQENKDNITIFEN